MKVKEEPERKKQNECKIGFLIDSKSGINALSSGTENGLFVGNYILPVGDYSKYMGIVIYDADEDIIYVTTNRVLSGEERLYVSKEFECSGQPCIYIIQPKIGDRRTMEVGHGC